MTIIIITSVGTGGRVVSRQVALICLYVDGEWNHPALGLGLEPLTGPVAVVSDETPPTLVPHVDGVAEREQAQEEQQDLSLGGGRGEGREEKEREVRGERGGGRGERGGGRRE